MFYLVYVSTAAHNFSRTELVALLAKSKENNARRDITGMLLYKDGNFMQALEGEETAVRALYATICADPRHKNWMVIDDGFEDARQFGDWSMGFRDLNDPDIRSIPGFVPFLDTALDARAFGEETGSCWELLNLFRHRM
jgi:hypothetical protein